MIFEEHKGVRTVFSWLGFAIGYAIFTTMLFFILTLLNKLPTNAGYFFVAKITASVIILGLIIRRLLR